MNNPAITNLVVSLGAMQGELHELTSLLHVQSADGGVFAVPSTYSVSHLSPTTVISILLVVARKLPLDNPDYLTYLRIGYLSSQLHHNGCECLEFSLGLHHSNDINILSLVHVC
jgi:hypothetical protein